MLDDDRKKMTEALHLLLQDLESGELSSAVIRYRLADGTQQEIVVGETEEDRALAVARLRQVLRRDRRRG